jgi:hypothetical protein
VISISTHKKSVLTVENVLGGDIYPALGGDYPANMGLSSTQALASNITGMIVPLSGHWIPEEQPKFVIEQLAMFLTSKFVYRLGLIASVMLYLKDSIYNSSDFICFTKISISIGFSTK